MYRGVTQMYTFNQTLPLTNTTTNMYGFSSNGRSRNTRMRGDCQHALSLLNQGAVEIPQEKLDQIGDTYVIGGVGDVDEVKRSFITSLPNTVSGLAMRAKKLRSYHAYEGLRDTYNYSEGEVNGLRKSRKDVRDEFLREKVNSEWLDRLPNAPTAKAYMSFEREWLSEEETISTTGINFRTLALKQAAGAEKLYLCSVEDLKASNVDVHVGKETLYLNRNIPWGMERRSKDMTYFGEGDAHVPKWELEGYDEDPSGKPSNYKPSNFTPPTEKTF